MDKKEIIFYCILFWILLTFFPLSGCSLVEITHDTGSLPKLDIMYGKDFCTDDLHAKVRKDELTITCSVKI